MTSPMTPTTCSSSKPFAAGASMLAQQVETLTETQQFDEAMHLLETLLSQEQTERKQTEPEQAEAAYLLGRLLLQHSSKPEKAVQAIELAVSLSPASSTYRLLLVEAYRANRQAQDALAQLRLLLELEPECLLAFEALGFLLESYGYSQEAQEAFQRAVALKSTQVNVYLTLARLQQQNEAPNSEEAKGKELALTTLEQAIEIFPEQKALLCFLKCALLERLNRPKEAEEAYQAALAQTDNPVALHMAMAETFAETGQAVEATKHFVEVLSLEPQQAQAVLGLAQVLLNEQRPKEAIALLERFKDANSANEAIFSLLAQAYGDLGEVSKALASYDDLLALAMKTGAGNDGLWFRKLFTLPVVPTSEAAMASALERSVMAIKTLSKLTLKLNHPVAEVAATPYFLATQQQHLLAPLKQLGQLIQSSLPSIAPLQASSAFAATSNRTLRVGVLSRYVAQAEHPIGKLFSGFFTGLDANRFETVLLLPPNSQSNGWPQASRVMTLPSVQQANWPALVEQIRQLELDVLVFPDAGLEPWAYWLSHQRLAVKQVALWGYPLSTGSLAIDAYMAPATALQGLELTEAFSEAKVLGLEGLGCVWQDVNLIASNAPASNALPPKPLFRDSFGLLPHQKALLLPWAPFRFHPQQDNELKALLARHPELVVLLCTSQHPYWDKALEQRLREACGEELSHGLHQLGYLRPADKRQLMGLADACLDSNSWQDAAQVLESLSLGTPVLSRQSSRQGGKRVTLRSAFTAGAYKALAWQEKGYLAETTHWPYLQESSLESRQEEKQALKTEFAQRLPSLNQAALSSFEAALLSLFD